MRQKPGIVLLLNCGHARLMAFGLPGLKDAGSLPPLVQLLFSSLVSPVVVAESRMGDVAGAVWVVSNLSSSASRV